MTEHKTLSPDALICGSSIRLLALETTKSKWTTTFIGSRPGRYLIVDMPKLAGAPVKLDDGTRWAANFISKGAVYSFNTEVLGYTYRLVPLLFLSYPTDVEVANLRTEKRYPVNIPVVFTITGIPPAEEGAEPVSPPSDALKALIVDISEGGFMMACPLPLPLDTTIEAALYLPKGEPIGGVKATVRACRGKPGGCFIGLAYDQSNPPGVMERLNALISNIENMPLRL